uniref:hypothetical protein n=1 Tax=Salmonella sp. TaxID=599 RepID=UPI001CD92F7B|nr:hypothetical protein [Salmonella sp.]
MASTYGSGNKLTDSGMSSHGAPIVGPTTLLNPANGRSMGIWRAYEQATGGMSIAST